MFNWFKPKIFNQGYLPEQDGHQVYYVEVGNPQGQPVLVFHGGPGGSLSLHHAQMFSKRKYRVILFDQRGSGKSLPAGETQHNTTEDLLTDAQRLLDFLKIQEKVIVSGGSWGSTLALLFAEKYPHLVKTLLLSKIFLADETAATWINKISGWFYPDMMEKVCKNIPLNKNLPQYFEEMIQSENLENQVKAVSLYGRYEWMMGKLAPQFSTQEVTAEDVASTKIYLHYGAQEFMILPEQILSQIERITDIPTLIVHNRLDMVCPLIGAWRLHKALPLSKLVIVPEKGHFGPLMSKTLACEIKKFLQD